MTDNKLPEMSELELEFTQELRGYGSLLPFLVNDLVDKSTRDLSNQDGYIGYDIRPEDIEALYFEGIGVPRWESIEAENVEQQLEIYNKSMQGIMSDYPLIQRVSDTDQKVEYTSRETLQLSEECARVMQNTADPKAIRALQKFSIACEKATHQQMGLVLIPS